MATKRSGNLRLGCIADDFTGATDLAGELVKSGLRTTVLVGRQAIDVGEAEAVVVALKSRVSPPREAVADSVEVLRELTRAGARHIFFKYCSTFDSTAKGNIGPVLHALAAELGAAFTIACPAFPENGRTVYQGHLFVGDRLLNRSGMERHPLNPMAESDLVKVLQQQYPDPVGLVAYQDIRADAIAARVASLHSGGHAVAIADAVDEACLQALAAWCVQGKLSSGASGLGAAIGRELSDVQSARPASLSGTHGRRAIIAGSCSTATLGQIAHAKEVLPALFVAPGEISLEAVETWLASQPVEKPILIYSSEGPEAIADKRRAGVAREGDAIETFLADIAAVLCSSGVGAMVVAGGETSGAVLTRLGVRSLAIGPEISPGVPWTMATLDGGQQMALALKSGNFGSRSFLTECWELLP